MLFFPFLLNENGLQFSRSILRAQCEISKDKLDIVIGV